jgi:hypothetical protein
LTTTGWVGPGTEAPEMPATNARVWVLALPIRIVAASPALPALPTSMLFEPVVRLAPADAHPAVAREPVDEGPRLEAFATAEEPAPVHVDERRRS